MNFLSQSSPASAPATPSRTQRQRLGNEEPPTVGEDQIREHLTNLKVHKSMGPDEMHLRVLREKRKTWGTKGQSVSPLCPAR